MPGQGAQYGSSILSLTFSLLFSVTAQHPHTHGFCTVLLVCTVYFLIYSSLWFLFMQLSALTLFSISVCRLETQPHILALYLNLI